MLEYIFTERAHLMCPRMVFGIVAAARRPYDENAIRSAMERLAAAHPFLNALLGYEEERSAYFYRITDRPTAEILLKGRELGGIDSPEVMEEYRGLTEREWDLFSEGMLKAAAWPMGKETCFLLVFHHLLADGRGALGLAEELADLYALGREPAFAPERLIASAADLPADSRMPFASRSLVAWANRLGARERRPSWGEYLAFAEKFLKKDPVTYSVTRLSEEETERLAGQCRENGVTVNDRLIADMMIGEGQRRVVMARDLRDRFPFYVKGAMGNYSTAFGVEVKKLQTDPLLLARAVHGEVKRKTARNKDLFLVLRCYANLDPGIIDGAVMCSRGGFPGRAGRFVGDSFFGYKAAKGYSVTNLGRTESGSISAACFIPPASPAIRKTRGVLTLNGVMTVCDCERRQAP